MYELPHLLNRQSELLAGAPQRIMQWDTVTGRDEKNKRLPGNRKAEIIPQELKCSFKLAPDTEVTDVSCRSCPHWSSCDLCCMYVAGCNRNLNRAWHGARFMLQRQAEPMAFRGRECVRSRACVRACMCVCVCVCVCPR